MLTKPELASYATAKSGACPADDEYLSYVSIRPVAVYSLGVIAKQRWRHAMAIEIDPVCGMRVDTETTDLKVEHDGTTYWFCGRGCMLEFQDDPEKYLDPEYKPSM